MGTAIEIFENWDAELNQARASGNSTSFFSRARSCSYILPRSQNNKGFDLLATQSGNHFLAAFTSDSEFEKWTQPHSGTAWLGFEMLHHIIVDDLTLSGLGINPFGNQLVLTRNSLTSLENSATGMAHTRVEHSSKLFLKSAKYDIKLEAAFVEALKNSGMEIFEAFILMARQKQNEKIHLLFLTLQ